MIDCNAIIQQSLIAFLFNLWAFPGGSL